MSNPTHLRKRTLRQGRALIRSWRQSGLSATAFARQIGVHPNRITFWKRRLALVDQPATPAQPTAFIRLPNAASKRHRLLSEHLTAEYRVRTSGRGRELDEWKLRPEGLDNHWLDGVVGCAAAASMVGAMLAGTEAGTRSAARPRLRLSQLRLGQIAMAITDVDPAGRGDHRSFCAARCIGQCT